MTQNANFRALRNSKGKLAQLEKKSNDYNETTLQEEIADEVKSQVENKVMAFLQMAEEAVEQRFSAATLTSQCRAPSVVYDALEPDTSTRSGQPSLVRRLNRK